MNKQATDAKRLMVKHPNDNTTAKNTMPMLPRKETAMTN